MPGRDSQECPLVRVEVTSTSWVVVTLDTECVGDTDPTREQVLSARDFAFAFTCGDPGPRSSDVEFMLPSPPSFRDPDTWIHTITAHRVPSIPPFNHILLQQLFF